MSIENIKKMLKEESKPDTTWMPAAKKRAEEIELDYDFTVPL